MTKPHQPGLFLSVSILAALAVLPYQGAAAEVTCIQAVNKVVKKKIVTQLKSVKRATKCKKGEVLAQAGATGPSGADGSLRVYGDGSAGAKTISTDSTLTDSNLMFTDFVVDVGQTLTVPSGTVIRCTGQFINRGTITVSPGAPGGVTNFPIGLGLAPHHFSVTAHPGISRRSAANGEYGNDDRFKAGGSGGVGITAEAARLLRYPGSNAGGGGGGSFSQGGQGGGALTVLCSNGITNEGTIEADGRAPAYPGFSCRGGGGGGGVIILASKSFVTIGSGGVMSASGGSGGNPGQYCGGGGGGGGGVIHLMAPTVTTSGATITVAGGPQGLAAEITTETGRSAGGGGGGSGGGGGYGHGLTFGSAVSGDGADGGPGYSLTSIVDPTALF